MMQLIRALGLCVVVLFASTSMAQEQQVIEVACTSLDIGRAVVAQAAERRGAEPVEWTGLRAQMFLSFFGVSGVQEIDTVLFVQVPDGSAAFALASTSGNTLCVSERFSMSAEVAYRVIAVVHSVRH
jgi:hypothetical protein